MAVQVSKEMTFDCAHMLSGHKGLCSNLHGHTYKVQVIVHGDISEERGDSSEAMVMDFHDLKDMMQAVILKQYDHALIISGTAFRNEAEEALLAWAKEHNMRHVVIKGRTTAETIAHNIAYQMWTALEKVTPKISVRLWETPTSCVEVHLDEDQWC